MIKRIQTIEYKPAQGFESAHRLPNMPEGHKCRRLHGHSFTYRVLLRGPVCPVRGLVVDFAKVKDGCNKLHNLLDHQHLNELEGLQNPTAENLAKYIYDVLKAYPVPYLHAVWLHETCRGAARYCPSEDLTDDA